MPKKQKIEVNEDLKVSIGDIFHRVDETSAGDTPLRVPHDGVSCNAPSNTKDQYNSETRKTKQKFGRISFQHQRAGRGGRTVTLISIPGETEQKLKILLKELKKSLGCGGQIEEGKIVLQGEIADRASEWFKKYNS